MSKLTIPLYIFQTWHSTYMPLSVKKSIEDIRKNNPEFTHVLSTEPQNRSFIETHFPFALSAYDRIIPYAIKADLWRYCVLYKYGGIYIDVKYSCINHFKFIHLINDEHFCKDYPTSKNDAVYNGIFVCFPENKIFYNAIYQIVGNVNTKFYGDFPTSPTGPRLLKQYFTKEQIDHFLLTTVPNKYIVYKNTPILKFHDNYKKEQRKSQPHWVWFWTNRLFYK